MSQYRSVAARMSSARHTTQGKLDKRLERLSEQLSELLGELSDIERMALDCWRHSSLGYEVDHTALTQKPYVSIRKVERVEEVYDVADTLCADEDDGDEERTKAQLAKFLNIGMHE